MNQRSYARKEVGSALALKPRAITTEKQQMVIEYLCEGNYLKHAIVASGITESCWSYWLRLYREDDPRAHYLHEFMEMIDQAIALAAVNAVRKMRLGKTDWKSEAWFLERRFAHYWGRKDRSSVPIPAPPKPIEEMDDAELDKHEEMIRAAAGKNGHRRRT